MVDFSGLADKAKNLVAEHAEQVKDGIGKAGDFVSDKFGDKIGHDKIDQAEQKAGEMVDNLADDHVTPQSPPVVPPPAAPPIRPAE